MATTADVNETQSKTSKGQTYRSRLWVIASGAIPAGLYVLYVYHYALNVPLVDDWQVMPIVSKAIHGEIDIHAIWKQWSDGREVMGNLVFVAFAIVDHLNLRAVMLFNATVFVLTYVIVLLLFRGYLGKRLPPLSAFVLGVVWFSLVDGQSALWAVKVEGYLTIFFTLVTVSLLLIRRGDDRLLFSLSVVAAVMASFSFVAGFAVWPLGLICLLWQSKWDKMKIATWVIAGGLTSVSYFYGYSFGNSSCQTTGANCSLLQGLSHPIQLGQYLILLVGDVIPTSTGGIEAHLWVHDVQGIVLFIAALLVVVQTVRERHDQPSPLPLLLILFAILFDLTTTLARVGGGPQSAIRSLGRPIHNAQCHPAARHRDLWLDARTQAPHGNGHSFRWVKRTDGIASYSVRSWDRNGYLLGAHHRSNRTNRCSNLGQLGPSPTIGVGLRFRCSGIPRVVQALRVVPAGPDQ